MTGVLHLSARDNEGGAARATYRLHQGLQKIGVDSKMLVQKKVTSDETVFGPSGKFGTIYDIVRRKLDELPVHLYPNRRLEIFSPGWIPERREVGVKEHDPKVVNLHWVAGGFLQPRTINKFEVPIVWTLHDMWPITGGCHYTGKCTKYKEECGGCPHLGSNKPSDLSKNIWSRKREAWENLSFTLVTPSQWLAESVRESTLFEGSNVEVIPNGLDVEMFRPRPPNQVRTKFGMDPDSNLICFGSNWATPRKGMNLLQDALEKMDYSKKNIEVAIFGQTEKAINSNNNYRTHYLGFVQDKTLQGLYSDADVVVVPSRQEAFGQTASEAIASGTPVVAFDASGPRDIVDHKKTGYLATPFNTSDLAQGIEWVLEDVERRNSLGHKARKSALERFSIDTVAREYQAIYEKIQ